MSISRGFVNYSLPTFFVTATPERMQAFTEAIGSENSETAAPTFMKVIEGEDNSSRRILDALCVDLKRVLHAEQQFDYFAPIRAGDSLRVDRRVVDIYEKKGGAMEFIVIESLVHNADETLVGKSRQLVLLRNPTPQADTPT
jgi:hypothetical protein